ncbi:hypothetical protein NE237_001885 [Protea cynaroides]|uniref:Uncharacterized protein n=1 Tax=Protea cynaroides TaxID=273540 RepID=A0A9Q0KUZ4_9MAGN|nr:hypothetical protein NE237_001885 [Protea cynaroides]
MDIELLFCNLFSFSSSGTEILISYPYFEAPLQIILLSGYKEQVKEDNALKLDLEEGVHLVESERHSVTVEVKLQTENKLKRLLRVSSSSVSDQNLVLKELSSNSGDVFVDATGEGIVNLSILPDVPGSSSIISMRVSDQVVNSVQGNQVAIVSGNHVSSSLPVSALSPSGQNPTSSRLNPVRENPIRLVPVRQIPNPAPRPQSNHPRPQPSILNPVRQNINTIRPPQALTSRPSCHPPANPNLQNLINPSAKPSTLSSFIAAPNPPQ